jgi:hypothetical protein
MRPAQVATTGSQAVRSEPLMPWAAASSASSLAAARMLASADVGDVLGREAGQGGAALEVARGQGHHAGARRAVVELGLAGHVLPAGLDVADRLEQVGRDAGLGGGVR